MNVDKININELFWQPRGKSKPILDNISEVITSGNFYGILGPNGAGKSSLVRKLLNLSGFDSGDISFVNDADSSSISKLSRHDMALALSFLPQDINGKVDFTVKEIVSMGREPYRRAFKSMTGDELNMIDEAMIFTNCFHLKDTPICLLSGGERQRVMIARTIVQDSPWIILDEPVSNLDVKHQEEIMLVLKRLNKEKKKTIIAILHNIDLANTFCNKIILMKEGKIYAMGDTKSILTKDNLKAVYDMDFSIINKDTGGTYIVPNFNAKG